MKKNNTITAILFLFYALLASSQSVIEINTTCDNKVSTHWSDPANNNLPLFDDDDDPNTPPVPNTQDDRYLKIVWIG